MTHTPGPWKVATLGGCYWGRDCKGHIDVESADGTLITTAPLPMERIDDARLIAAAPDLLKLAEHIIGFCVTLRQDHECWQQHLDAGILFAETTKIIAKATP